MLRIKLFLISTDKLSDAVVHQIQNNAATKSQRWGKAGQHKRTPPTFHASHCSTAPNTCSVQLLTKRIYSFILSIP